MGMWTDKTQIEIPQSRMCYERSTAKVRILETRKALG